jgi:hypothetical protein
MGSGCTAECVVKNLVHCFVTRVESGWADYVACIVLKSAKIMDEQYAHDVRMTDSMDIAFDGQTILDET